MNGRKAKRLRKMAQEQTVGLPDRRYEAVALNPQKPHRTTIRLVACTRQRYQELKANA